MPDPKPVSSAVRRGRNSSSSIALTRASWAAGLVLTYDRVGRHHPEPDCADWRKPDGRQSFDIIVLVGVGCVAVRNMLLRHGEGLIVGGVLGLAVAALVCGSLALIIEIRGGLVTPL